MNLAFLFIILSIGIGYMLYDNFKRSRGNRVDVTNIYKDKLKTNYTSQCKILKELHQIKLNHIKNYSISIHLNFPQCHIQSHHIHSIIQQIQLASNHSTITLIYPTNILNPIFKTILQDQILSQSILIIPYNTLDGAVAILRQLNAAVHLETDPAICKIIAQYLPRIWLSRPSSQQQCFRNFQNESNIFENKMIDEYEQSIANMSTEKCAFQLAHSLEGYWVFLSATGVTKLPRSRLDQAHITQQDHHELGYWQIGPGKQFQNLDYLPPIHRYFQLKDQKDCVAMLSKLVNVFELSPDLLQFSHYFNTSQFRSFTSSNIESLYTGFNRKIFIKSYGRAGRKVDKTIFIVLSTFKGRQNKLLHRVQIMSVGGVLLHVINNLELEKLASKLDKFIKARFWKLQSIVMITAVKQNICKLEIFLMCMHIIDRTYILFNDLEQFDFQKYSQHQFELGSSYVEYEGNRLYILSEREDSIIISTTNHNPLTIQSIYKVASRIAEIKQFTQTIIKSSHFSQKSYNQNEFCISISAYYHNLIVNNKHLMASPADAHYHAIKEIISKKDELSEMEQQLKQISQRHQNEHYYYYQQASRNCIVCQNKHTNYVCLGCSLIHRKAVSLCVLVCSQQFHQNFNKYSKRLEKRKEELIEIDDLDSYSKKNFLKDFHDSQDESQNFEFSDNESEMEMKPQGNQFQKDWEDLYRREQEIISTFKSKFQANYVTQLQYVLSMDIYHLTSDKIASFQQKWPSSAETLDQYQIFSSSKPSQQKEANGNLIEPHPKTAVSGFPNGHKIPSRLLRKMM